MAAFDKFLSGFPQMDDVLDFIRLGDNVVWQISELDEFRTFAEPFARQAVRDAMTVGRFPITQICFRIYLTCSNRFVRTARNLRR